MITVKQCPCGHRGCTTYQLVGIGLFYTGCGFSKEEAELIATLLNQYYEAQGNDKREDRRPDQEATGTVRLPQRKRGRNRR